MILKRFLLIVSIATAKIDKKYTSFVAHDDNDILMIRQLHAKQFLSKKFITQEQINTDGAMDNATDPYHESSLYFGVRDSKGFLVAGGRFIIPDDTVNELQAVVNTKISSKKELQILQSLDPALTVEISGLSKEQGYDSGAVMVLYREFWRYSKRHGYNTWIFTVNKGFEGALVAVFGPAMMAFGERSSYMNTSVQPYMIRLDVPPVKSGNLAIRLMRSYITG